MRVLVQRVKNASVSVIDASRESTMVASIQDGVLLLVGVSAYDGKDEAAYLARKIAGMRIFEDAHGKMNLALGDVGGSVLAVSQFTLYADLRKGRRPSFSDAARPEHAEPLYMHLCDLLEHEGITVARGVFQAHMHVELTNDGPVTLWLDTDELMNRKS